MFLRKMQLTLFLVLLVVWLPKAIFCQEQPFTEENAQAQPELAHHKIRTGNSVFAGRLLKLLISENPNKNVFFSPMSISTAFAMLSLGAKTATLTNLLEGLGFNLTELQEEEIHKGFQDLVHLLNTTTGKVQLENGNGIFVDDHLELLQSFIDDVKNLYGAEVFAANFADSEAAKKQINDYVDMKTHGKIPEFIKELQSNVVMILINHIFFKGNWETAFNSSFTELQDFHVDENTIVKVPMMWKKEKLCYQRENEQFFSMVVLPYEGNAQLTLVLPDEGKLEQTLDAIITNKGITCSKSMDKRKVSVYLPKFSISTSLHLEQLLPKIGITNVFTNNADLTGIAKGNLQVSKVVHKAALEVSENGTVAAAATGIEVQRFIAAPPIVIHFNRPFLLFINGIESRQSLFMGRIVNPTVNN